MVSGSNAFIISVFLIGDVLAVAFFVYHIYFKPTKEQDEKREEEG